jgi:hypothetical protein
MKQPIFSIFLSLFAYMTHAQSSMSDVKSLLKQLTGEFDNFQQVWQEKEDKLPDSLRHEHIHSIFTPAEIPALGQNLLFVKQYRDGDTTKMGQLCIYRFSPDKKEKAIRLDIFTFKNEKTYKIAEHNPLILKALKLKDFDSANECTIFWKRQKEVFLGYMKSNTCDFAVEEKKEGKDARLQLTKDALWIRDESAAENSNPIFANFKKIHNKLMRCKPFKGWFAVKQDDKDEKFEFVGNLRVHDQGWKKRVVLPNGTVTPYSVELSQVMYKKSIAVLKLAVYEEGKENAIESTWTHSAAERIGIHARNIQAGFTLVNQKH